MKKRIHIGAEISEEFDREIRIQAAKLRISRSEFFRKALHDLLNNLKDDNNEGNRYSGTKGQRSS